MNKLVVGSVIRHILTVVATLLVSKGISIDGATLDMLAQLITGVLLGTGVIAQSYISKAKPVDVLVQDPIDVESTKSAPKGFHLSNRSLNNLKGVDKDLVRVMKIAIVDSPYDWVITEGLRSAERQREMLRTKKSRVKRSKHQDGLACDIMCYDEHGKGTWDLKYYKAVADHIKEVAMNEGLEITWGGDWTDLVDGVHFEIKGAD